MALRRRVVLATPALLATTAILAATGVLDATHPAAAQTAAQQTAQQTTGFRTATITAADGTALEANVIEPATAGRHPAIVFISSWGLNDAEYLAQATAFAQAGYTVLSYTTRGFWDSGGQIDTAGPKDIADVSSILDWLIAHTGADPGRIGVAGVSYGAGIGLIASAADPRIRAVAAMSGWTDLVESLYGGNTRRPQAAFLLAAPRPADPPAERRADRQPRRLLRQPRRRRGQGLGPDPRRRHLRRRHQRQPPGHPDGQRLRGQPVRP